MSGSTVNWSATSINAPLMPHQCDMADAGLTYHFQIWAAEMGTGKSLAAQEVMERSGVDLWYWIGPKTSLPNIRREFRKWNMDPTICVEMMTYEALVRKMDDWKTEDELPRGVIFDESSKLKTTHFATLQGRTIAWPT